MSMVRQACLLPCGVTLLRLSDSGATWAVVPFLVCKAECTLCFSTFCIFCEKLFACSVLQSCLTCMAATSCVPSGQINYVFWALQVEVHPYFRNDRLYRYCQDHNIHVTAYAPVSSPATMKNQGYDVPNLLNVCTTESILGSCACSAKGCVCVVRISCGPQSLSI